MSDIESIVARNNRVEADKAWETSLVRKLCIAGFTYVFIALYLPFLGVEKSYLHATVPMLGYLFSTLSLGFIKTWWVQNSYNKKKVE